MSDLPDFDLSAYWQEPDFLLTDLVSLMANKANSQLGVTLMIKGAILTGTLVGEREYLRRINEMFKRMARESIVKPTKEDLASIDAAFSFDDLSEDNYEETDEDGETQGDGAKEADAPEPAPIRHLHLKDPVIIYPGSTLSFMDSELPILRIRLATIDGWMLGRVSVLGDEDDLPDVGFIH
ncbi:MAG TPA: hypothetical protein VHD90_21675 [Phototrophicaceae bacterium]|nr:hypothetical protein [Phototrophicaceae bacterium]